VYRSHFHYSSFL